MPDRRDFYFDRSARCASSTGTRGRVVLLGDAGYCGSPLAGLGTSMALVGAYVLAGELAGDAAATIEAARSPLPGRLRDYVAAGPKLPPGGVNGYAPQRGR